LGTIHRRRDFLVLAGAAASAVLVPAGGGNHTRATAAATRAVVTPTRLFWTRFEPSTALGPYPGGSGYQDITGQDSATGYAWPPRVNGGLGHLQLIDLDRTVPDSIVAMRRHDGTTGPVLHQVITTPPGSGNCQNPYVVEPGSDAIDLYVRYWLYLPADLPARMTAAPEGGWRLVYEFKTRDRYGRDDYRFGAMIRRGGDHLYWYIGADLGSYRKLSGDKEVWVVENHTVPVPLGRWFKFECYWHRSRGPDARFWVAVDRTTISDHYCDGKDGAQTGSYGVYGGRIDRIMCFQMYGNDRPQEQWVDDFVIYDGVPGDAVR
jgi:hypothetical protein